ncbi:MAG: flagellar biosynthesis protein FlhB [Pseudobdellovibrionaceae bacterium]
MAGEDQDQEKTEEATDTRREEFRKKGQVVQSRELASALFLLFGAGAIYMMGQFFFSQLFELFQFTMGPDMVQAVRGGGDMFPALKLAGIKFIYLIAPILGVGLILGVASTVLQIGFLQVEDALEPKIDKINPLEGFKRIFSIRNAVEGIKSILKLAIVAYVTYLLLKTELNNIPTLIQLSVSELMKYTGTVTAKLLGGVGMAMVGLTIADYFFQRWDNEKKMMMTKQEVKEENKQREGDPLIKARIRRVQREVANRRMMDKVPKATVIITNPTHIAIALRYDDQVPAPQLVAKGADLVAEKIKEIARQNNIPIIENKPLARTIFKTMKLGQVIPRELYVAVAEVLSFVFRLKRKAGKKS